jgi:ubiquinone/menaquinone biosynthesis C-methylase UbiE
MAGPDHPMRKVTRQVAFEPDGWTPDRAAKVGQLFDALAETWKERTSEDRRGPLRDALERGGIAPGGCCVEMGSGTGSSSPDLANHFDSVIALDLSREMLRRAPEAPARRVQGDAAKLPVGDARANCVVLVNALLFPLEMDRVLTPSGTLVWVNSLGDRTPIHLSAEDVDKAMPGEWEGVAAEAAWGTWCTLRRARVENG